MADNVLIKPASGTGTVSVRAVEISGQLYSPAIPADSSGNFYTPNAISQNVVLSSNNNYTGTLATLTTLTRTGETTLNSAGIQVNLEADQTCTVWIEQSQDNVTWLISDQFNYVKNSAFGMTVQATASYFRVRIKNNSTATANLKLQSVLCPVVEAVPRALDSRGNLKVGLQDLTDRYGFTGMFTPFRDLKVCEPYRLVGAVFGDAADTNFWTVSNSGTLGAAAGVAGGIATLESGTANSGYGQIVSVRNARFMSAHPHLYRGNIRVQSTTAANNTRRWGSFTVSGQTPQNGFYFELSAAGALSVNHVSGASVTTVPNGSFNGDVPEYVMNTSVHTYEIIYVLMSAKFYIDSVLIHTFTPTTARLTQTLHLQTIATTANSASGTVNGLIEVWSMTIVRLGRATTQSISKYQSGTTAGVVCKLGPGQLHSIVISAVANGAVVTLYDNTTATGTILWSSGTLVQSAQLNPDILTISFPEGIPFFTGLSFAITTANANVLAVYE
jgi:hypothetical protein